MKLKYGEVQFYWACAALALTLSGCAGTFKHELSFNPNESIRVAVLPFVQVNSQGGFVEDDGKLVVDVVPILSSEVKESPSQVVRKLVQSRLGQTSKLDLVLPALIDVDLPHHGFVTKANKFDYAKLYSASPADICQHYLDCDAVLYGYVKKWDRSYYGVQSVNTVGIELKLVSGRDGRVLFSTTAEDSDSRGLSKGPTGYSSIVLEPLKGLDSEIIGTLAESVVNQALKPLTTKGSGSIQPGAPPPAIFAASHDITTGSLMRDKPLSVVAFGSGMMTASFSIGSVIEDVPMVERSEGHYFGEFFPLDSDMFNGQRVVVKLVDTSGRVSEKEINEQSLTLTGAQ